MLARFYKTLQSFGVVIPDEYVVASPYRDSEAAYRATKKLLELPDPPTCILFPDDISSFGGMNAIREKGLRIPEDISIAGYDGIRIAKVLEPKLATIEQDTETIGDLAARKLVQMIERPKTSISERIVVTGKLLTGGSIKNLENPA